MSVRRLRQILLNSTLFLLTALWSSSAFGQAVLTVSATGSTVSRTGHTEPVGNVSLTVASGTSVAGTVEITYGLVLANNAASGITITGNGGLAGATISAVIQESGIVILSIPAGATVGSFVTLNGVRTSIVGNTSTSINASVSSTGNSIVAGQNSVRVINSITDALIVENSVAPSVIFRRGILIAAPDAFNFVEGRERAFSSGIGIGGQTAVTQVIFKVTGLPDNVSLTFPASVTSASGASLTTTSGAAETLTNESGTNRVVYNFLDSISSPTQIDSFSVTPDLATTGSVGTGTAFIQATMGPIGAAQPTAEFPSTAVPRFAELFLPVIEVVAPAPLRFFIPIPTPVNSQNVVITNTSTGGAAVTVRARGEDGLLVSGLAEARLNLSAKQTGTYTLAQLFGSAASTNQIASIEVESENDRILPSAVSVLSGGSVSTGAGLRELSQSYLPFERRVSSDVPVLAILNAGQTAGAVQFTLRTSLGATLATTSRTIAAGGALRTPLTTLLNLQPGALPMSGYLLIDSTVPLRSVMFNHPTEATDAVGGLVTVARSPMIFPFFAFGGGYSTVMNLVNVSNNATARVTVTLYNRAGVAFAGAPVSREIAPQNRIDLDLGSLFGTGSSAAVSSGYVVLTVQAATSNPFSSLPPVVGTVRVSTNTSSVQAPLVTDPGTEFFVSPTAETSSLYTGFAIANDGAIPTTVTLEAYSSTGGFLGTRIFTLPGGNARIELLRELIPATLPHDGGFVRISSTSAINVVVFRGNLIGTELFNLPLQIVP